MPSNNTMTDEVALTILVPRNIKRQLAAIAAIEETTLKQIVNLAISTWLTSRKDKAA